MTIKAIRSIYIDSLKPVYGESEAEAMADMMLEHFAGADRSAAFLRSAEEINTGVEKELEETLVKLLSHIPVQQVIGYAWFYNLKFRVNEHVLIPRPETEELVHEAIDHLKKNKGRTIIDIGTGSGCIPISIKKNIADAEIMSIDVSEDAIAVAKENAAINNVVVDFRKINFLNEEEYESLPVVDIIISNPPYIPEDEKETMDKNVVLNEPHLALFVPQNDPLIFYKKIRAFAQTHLAKDGAIFLEVHENLANETAELFSQNGYTVNIKKDIPGKDRMLIINRCPKL